MGEEKEEIVEATIETSETQAEATPVEETVEPEIVSDAEETTEAAPAIDEKEIEEGKVFAILGYILPIICLIPLIQRNNDFSLFHAKQVLVLWVSMMAISMVNIVPCLGQIVWLAFAILVLVLDIMGLISAIKGETKTLPIAGAWAADWFKSITKIKA